MNNGCHEFYYEMMDMNERAVYRAMYDGLKTLKVVLQLLSVNTERLLRYLKNL